MTIQLLFPYATYNRGSVVDLDNATEASLVLQQRAVYTSNMGPDWYPLTPQEQQDLRDGTLNVPVYASSLSLLLSTGTSQVAQSFNTNEINNALASGTAIINVPGTYLLNGMIELRSYSRLITAPGVEIKLAPGVNCNMLRNFNGQQIFDPARVTISNFVVTFVEVGHNRSVGDRVYIENVTGNTSVNGVQTITSVNGVGATAQWTITVASNNAITNTSTNRIWVGRYNPVLGSAFVRTTTTASVTWTSASPGVCTWTAHGRGANDPVTFSAAAMPTGLTAGTIYYVTPGSCTTNTFQVSAYPNGPALNTSSTGTTVVGYYGVTKCSEANHRRVVGDHVYVTGLAGTNTFNGPQKITAVVAGVSWSYVNAGVGETATGTANVLGDTNIFVDVWKLNYDADTKSFDALWSMIGVFVNVGNSEFNFRNNANGLGAGVTFYNTAATFVPVHKGTGDAVVNVKGSLQFSANCDDIHVGDVANYGCYDDILAWGFAPTSGVFGGTASPSGQGHMGTLSVDRVGGKCVAAGTGLKFAVADGFTLGSITVGEAVGVFTIAIGDPSVGTQGFIDQLTITNANNTPFDSATAQIAVAGFARINKLTLVDPRDQTSGQNYFLSVGQATVTMAVETIAIRGYVNQGSPTNIGVFIGAGTTTVQQLILTDSRVSLGAAGDFIRLNGSTCTLVHAIIANMRVVGPGNAGNLIATLASGIINNVRLSGVVGNCNNVLIAKTSQGSNMNVFVDGVQCNTLVADNSTAQQFTIFFNNLQNLGNNNTFMFNGGGSGTWRIRGGTLQHQAAFLCSFGGTTSVSIDCPEAQIDMGASAGAPPARLIPIAGDKLYNTNATGGGLYGRTAAGAWQLIF